jgi:hypothetical protein
LWKLSGKILSGLFWFSICHTILVEDQDGIGVVGMLVPGHCLLLGERCHLQKLLLWCCWLWADLPCTVCITMGPAHFLVALRILLVCILSRYYGIWLGSTFLKCMISAAVSMGLAIYSWVYIVVRCARPYQRPEKCLKMLLCSILSLLDLQQICWLFCEFARL